MTQNLISCITSHEHNVGANHLPIQTIIFIHTSHSIEKDLTYNYDKTDWEQVQFIVPIYLPNLIMPDTPQKLDNYAMDIVNAIKCDIDETTPYKRPCPHSKHWWSLSSATSTDKPTSSAIKYSADNPPYKLWNKPKQYGAN